MLLQQRFEQTIEALNQAAFDDALWPEASRLIDEACDSRGNFLVTGDRDATGELQITLARFYYRGKRDEELEQRYFEVLYPLDERVPRLLKLPYDKLVTVRSLFSRSELKNSLIYNEEMGRAQARNGLITLLELSSSAGILWQFADPVKGRDWSSDQIRMIERLMPHVQHSTRVRRALVEAQAIGQTQEALLDNNRIGIVQLNRLGQIASANDSAVATLRENVGLFDQDRFLMASAPDDNVKLANLISDVLAANGTQAMGGSITMTRSSGLPLVVHVTPVVNHESELQPGTIAALALIVDTGMKPRIDRELVGKVLGLTPPEAEVASLLAEGMTPQQIAVAKWCVEGTVRWHLHRIFERLQIDGQVGLVRLVLTISAHSIPKP